MGSMLPYIAWILWVSVDLSASRIFMDFQQRLIRTESEDWFRLMRSDEEIEVCPGWRASNGSFHAPDGSDVIVATNPTSGTADAAITSKGCVFCVFFGLKAVFLHCAMCFMCNFSCAKWRSLDQFIRHLMLLLRHISITYPTDIPHRYPTHPASSAQRSPENLWGSQYPGPLPPVDTRLQRHRWILGCFRWPWNGHGDASGCRLWFGDCNSNRYRGPTLFCAHTWNIFEFECVDWYTMCHLMSAIHTVSKWVCLKMLG